MSIIQDGAGTGNRTKVSGNRLFVHAVNEAEAVHATEDGDSYNINTGTVGLTSTTASGVLFLQNNEQRDIVIEALAAGVGTAGTTTDLTTVKVIRNPSSVSFSAAVDMNQNRNFGSSSTLTVDTYKGAEGATVTGGDEILQFFTGAGTRLFAPINIILPRGKCLAVTMDTNTTSGTTNVYAALVCYLKNEDLAH